MPTVMPGTVTTLEIPERVVSHKKIQVSWSDILLRSENGQRSLHPP